MVNPLALPLAAMEAIIALPRALVAIQRAVEVGERLDAQVEVIVTTGDKLVAAAERAERFADRLIEGGDKLVTAADRSEETADKLLASAEALRDMGGPLLGSSQEAQAELERATAELARANEQVARIIEMSGPFERVVNRLRRDSPSD